MLDIKLEFELTTFEKIGIDRRFRARRRIWRKNSLVSAIQINEKGFIISSIQAKFPFEENVAKFIY
jgi:hypothetical protein